MDCYCSALYFLYSKKHQQVFYTPNASISSLVYCAFLFFIKDEDPALRELAEMERESCVQDIQDLSKKVGVSNSIFGHKLLQFKVTKGRDLIYHSIKTNYFARSWIY